MPERFDPAMYCQKCGAQLAPVKVCASSWLTFYRCPLCNQPYLEVADARWIYPLLLLEAGALEKAVALSDEALVAAARNIEFIDYKTVSIVAFERALRDLS